MTSCQLSSQDFDSIKPQMALLFYKFCIERNVSYVLTRYNYSIKGDYKLREFKRQTEVGVSYKSSIFSSVW